MAAPWALAASLALAVQPMPFDLFLPEPCAPSGVQAQGECLNPHCAFPVQLAQSDCHIGHNSSYHEESSGLLINLRDNIDKKLALNKFYQTFYRFTNFTRLVCA